MQIRSFCLVSSPFGKKKAPPPKKSRKTRKNAIVTHTLVVPPWLRQNWQNLARTRIFDDIGHGRWSWSDGPIHENSKFSLFKKLLQFGTLIKIDQSIWFFFKMLIFLEKTTIWWALGIEITFFRKFENYDLRLKSGIKTKIYWWKSYFDELLVP